MNKTEIIKEYLSFVEKYKISVEDFVLCAGGACLMYGLREETNDMDMDIPKAMFDQFKYTNEYHLSYFGSIQILTYNKNIDLHICSGNYQTRMVEGVCCYSPNDLLIQKLRLNRPKDQRDILGLQKLLKIEKIKSPAYTKW